MPAPASPKLCGQLPKLSLRRRFRQPLRARASRDACYTRTRIGRSGSEYSMRHQAARGRQLSVVYGTAPAVPLLALEPDSTAGNPKALSLMPSGGTPAACWT